MKRNSRWPRLFALAVAGMLVTASAAPAQAQKKDPAEAEKQAKARKLYEEGITHYNLGEFDQAIEKFKEAYALSGAPGLLFNIAQAYRLKKDYEQALYFYKTYLRLQPEAANRADVEARIAEMEKLVEEQKKIQGAKPVGTLPPEGDQKPPGGDGQQPPPGGDGQQPPPGGDGQQPPDESVKQVADTGDDDDDVATATILDDDDTGVTTVWRPKSGTISGLFRADVDTATFAGAAMVVGGRFAVLANLEVGAAALFAGKRIGLELGATMLFSDEKLRPLASITLPMFYEDGLRPGACVSGGIRYDLSPRFGLQAEIGLAHFLSAPEGFNQTYFVPSVGIHGRL